MDLHRPLFAFAFASSMACSSAPQLVAPVASAQSGGPSDPGAPAQPATASPSASGGTAAPAQGRPSSAADCGVVADGLQTVCSPERDAKLSCIVDAALACEPARLQHRTTSDEGDVIVWDYLVVPTADGCVVTRSIDTTRDSHGPREVTVDRCGGIAKARTTSGCQTLVASQCS